MIIQVNLNQNQRNSTNLEDVFGPYRPEPLPSLFGNFDWLNDISNLKDIESITSLDRNCQAEFISALQVRIEKLTGGCKKYRHNLLALTRCTFDELRVFNHIVLWQAKHKYVFVAQETMAKALGLSRGFVCTTIKKLRKIGVLFIATQSKRIFHGKLDQRSNLTVVKGMFTKNLLLRKLFAPIIPALKALPISGITLILYTYKELTDYWTFRKPILSVGDKIALLTVPAYQLLKNRGQFHLNGTMYESFQGEYDMNEEISPVIDSISPELIPLTLNGKIFLSQFPEPALEYALEKLEAEKTETGNRLQVMKEAAWEYVKEHRLNRLKDKPDALRKKYNVSFNEPLVKKTVTGKTVRGARQFEGCSKELDPVYEMHAIEVQRLAGNFDTFKNWKGTEFPNPYTLTVAVLTKNYDLLKQMPWGNTDPLFQEKNARHAQNGKEYRYEGNYTFKPNLEILMNVPSYYTVPCKCHPAVSARLPEAIKKVFSTPVSDLSRHNEMTSDNAQKKEYFKALHVTAQPLVDDSAEWEEVSDNYLPF